MNISIFSKSSSALFLSLIASTIFCPVDVAEGSPLRGSVGWSVILCTYRNANPTTRDPNFFRDMFFRRGTGGLADYWDSVSYGAINLNGSAVRGWYTVPMTVEEARNRSRDDKYNDCKNAARESQTDSYTPPSNHLVAAITSPDVDLFGMGGVGAFLPDSVNLMMMGHEVGHGLGLDHSFSDDPTYRNADWAQLGEYDDQWDLMSAANVWSTPTARFGVGGPGLNAFHVDQMGWLSRDRIFTFGSDGIRSQTLTLAALNHPEASGSLLGRIPIDPNDPFHYYTVEYRKNDGWDAGFPSDIVLLHEVKRGETGSYYSYLLKSRDGSKQPIQTFQVGDTPYLSGVTIEVVSTSPSTNQATVSITSNIVDRCLTGYVWREANPNDQVCVTPKIREQTQRENELADSRRSPVGGAYGPDTCLQGYVWREAFPEDHVCVPRQSREQAWKDNQEANNRLMILDFTNGNAGGGIGSGDEHLGQPENTLGKPTDSVLERVYSGTDPYFGPKNGVPGKNTTSVPEPGTVLALALLGGGGLLTRLRRKQ